MTMKLTVKRFRTRLSEGIAKPSTQGSRTHASASTANAASGTHASAQNVASNGPGTFARMAPETQMRPVSQLRPNVAPGQQIGDDAFMPSSSDDGFGAEPFPTARPTAQPAVPSAAPSRMAASDAGSADPGRQDVGQTIDGIRKEGLTGRQLRMARRLAQKHGLPATSDFDAIRLLRAAGIDPFQANSILEFVTSAGANEGQAPGSRALALTPGGDGIRLPQTMKPIQIPSTEVRAESSHLAEVTRIQQDIMRRRRRKSMLLAARMFVFVGLPTILAAFYYYAIATPMYSTHTEFLIQQAEPAAVAGMASLMRNSPFATATDSIAVQGYLQSQQAMARLEADNGFRAHFADPSIDPIQRLTADATEGSVYKKYKNNVKISYDPTEGIIKLEVVAASPEKAVEFSNALIKYAEERVEGLTTRVREDQMKGAKESFADAEAKLNEANRTVILLQEKFKILSSEIEVSLITGQIGSLESQLSQDSLSLAQMESNASPNLARMEPLKRRIATLEGQIAALRAKLTEDSATGPSIANVQSELLVAQTDVQTRQLLLAQSLTSMESARLEANRQTRYLSVSVSPVAADEASYPRAFENTLIVLLIFAGIYLMISMTVAILREQVTA